MAKQRCLGKAPRAKYPFIKSVDRTITILAWTLLAAYLLSFLYWLYTRVIR